MRAAPLVSHFSLRKGGGLIKSPRPAPILKPSAVHTHLDNEIRHPATPALCQPPYPSLGLHVATPLVSKALGLAYLFIHSFHHIHGLYSVTRLTPFDYYYRSIFFLLIFSSNCIFIYMYMVFFVHVSWTVESTLSTSILRTPGSSVG